jgi:hypothetical protein
MRAGEPDILALPRCNRSLTFCRRLPVTLFADDVDLGKTTSAGLIASELIARGRISERADVARARRRYLGLTWDGTFLSTRAPTHALCKRTSAIATSSTQCATPSCRPRASRTSGATYDYGQMGVGNWCGAFEQPRHRGQRLINIDRAQSNAFFPVISIGRFASLSSRPRLRRR